MPQPPDQPCFHCQKTRPYDQLVPSEMLRPALQETIRKHDSNWRPPAKAPGSDKKKFF